MSHIKRTGFPCRMCGRRNACTEGSGNVVEGIPIKSHTPGDLVFCKKCLQAIALFIEESKRDCESAEREFHNALQFKGGAA